MRKLCPIAALLLAACAKQVAQPPPAVPVNLAQVDSDIWRSGQPTTRGQWDYVRSLGVHHVIKLNFESEGSDDEAKAAGLDVYVISIQPEGDKDLPTNIANTFVQPDQAKIVEAEKVIAAGGGVLVHCTHGEDRTGLIIGIHRVLHQGKGKDEAYSEMLEHHFHPELHGLHEYWERWRP